MGWRNSGGVVDLTNDDVADILAVLDSLPYDELDLRTPRFRLTLRRAPGGGWSEESQILADPVATASGPGTSADDSGIQPPIAALMGHSSGDAGLAGSDKAGLVPVIAPLPGTFYRAPRPGAAPFVDVGDEVGEDTVVAIVETMKLMNSVHAGTRGRVAEICLQNAELAAQGATLMWIAPES
jgi:acetyl-CoA carboxylase biotin carboxyl carrier protein